MSNQTIKRVRGTMIIVGCGRLGANVANMFSTAGMEVVIIDKLKTAFNKLPSSYSGFQIEADASDIHALEDAGVQKAGAVFVVTGDDNINIMVSEIAKVIYEIPTVVTRLYDTEKESLLKDSGIEVIYPAKLEIDAFRELFGAVSEE